MKRPDNLNLERPSSWNAIKDLLLHLLILSSSKIAYTRSADEKDGNHPASPHWLMTEEAGSNEEDWNFVSINASFRDEFPYRADPPQVVYLSADRRPFGRTGRGTFYFIVSRL